MKRSMTQRSYLGWQKYWESEPWGPWRDNMHVAILAREIRRTRARPGSMISLEQFLIRNPAERKKEGEQNFFGVMQAVATPVTPEEAEARRRARKRSSKKVARNDRPSKTRRKT